MTNISSSLFPTIMIFLLLLSILPVYVVIFEYVGGIIFSQSASAQLSGLTPVLDETIRPSSIVLMNIEFLPTKEKAGDAESNPNSLQLATQNVGEECCYKIQYTPGPIGKAGIAYKADKNYDLAGAKRVVFFAMGERGGEKVSFLAAGKDADVPTDIFKSKTFAAVTQDIVLEKDWRRYEMNIEGIDLIGVTYPFAFIVNKGQDLGTIVFSLKGVTYDSKAATDPLQLQETTNETSFSTTTTPATSESNSTTGSNNTNSTEGLAIASQDAEGNGTASNDSSGDLGPNKLSDDFKDSVNGNTSSAGGEHLVPQLSNQIALTTDNTANRTDTNTTAAVDNKTRLASMPKEHQMTNNTSSLSSLSTLQPLPPLMPRPTTNFTNTIQPMDNNTITSSGNLDPTTTMDNNIGNLTDPPKVTIRSETDTSSSEAPTIPNLDLHPLDTNTLGNKIISNNSGSNIASPSLIDEDQRLSMPTNQQYLYNGNQTSYGITGSQSPGPFAMPILPYTLAPYEYQNYTQSSSSSYSPLTASNTTRQGEVDGAENGNAGILENRNIGAAPSTATTITTLPQQYQVPPLTQQYQVPPLTQQYQVPPLTQQYQVPPLTQQYQVPPLTTSNTVQLGEVDGADNGNAGAATTLQQLPGSNLVMPPAALGSSPPDTAITSAIDSSTGLDIQNGGSASLSSSITFAFRDTDDLDIAGYVCSIDSLPAFACSSPVIIDRNILQAATGNNGGNDFGHSFQVSTIDTSGNVDPTPAVFHWIAADTTLPETIMTPEGLPQETITPNTNMPSTALPEPIITPETMTSNTFVSEIPALQALTP
jgi:hypothetical protein